MLEFRCICCEKTSPHSINWDVSGEIATVYTQCVSCGAAGISSIGKEIYRAPNSARIPKDFQIAMLNAVSIALSHAH
jgi:hypothetical protein